MSDSIYKVIEVVGSSPNSWEEAAKKAIERASESLRNLRVAEVIDQDIKIEDGKLSSYRTKLKLSFKFDWKKLVYIFLLINFFARPMDTC